MPRAGATLAAVKPSVRSFSIPLASGASTRAAVRSGVTRLFQE
jgi:hypothetical protein